MIPSLFPIYESASGLLRDGSVIKPTPFCQKSVHGKPQCRLHYESLKEKPDGYYQCPFGFTTRSFRHEEHLFAVTGVIAFPRFGSTEERDNAKKYPEVKTTRSAIEKMVSFIRDIERVRADAIQNAAKVLPQAFHELRKLNGAILQHAEREMKEAGQSRSLLSIVSAAELMRNNFDILEALSNIDSMKALPIDAAINLYDLAYKTKCVLQERAASKNIQLSLTGIRAIIRGSQKSFPIVPAVLLENAIKFGRARTTVKADVSAQDNLAVFSVENETEHFIDPARCFEKGVRFSSAVEGGGFGLFLAKQIVTAHNGTIVCDFADGKVRITVKLPLINVIPLRDPAVGR
jgi:signal transduction histidine kinase